MKKSYDDLVWSECERETAQFLVELYHRVSLMSSIPYSWRCKKKRSAIVENHGGGADAGAAVVVGPSCDAVKVQASSPATPLSFPATESDEKPKHLKKKKTSLKRKKEYYLNIIEDLTKTKDSLNQEIENVKRHSDQLKDFNLKLKLKEKELLSSNGPKDESQNPPNSEINQPMQLNHIIKGVNSSKSTAENEDDQKNKQQMPPIHHNFGLYQICSNGQGIVQFQCASSIPTTSLQVATSSTASLGRNNFNSNMGPLTIPDLNLSFEESLHVDNSQPFDEATANLDLSKAMAAEARQRRLQIFRLKKPVGNNNNTKQRQASYR